MNDFPHRSVLASAGSGKTFALTSRYLALLAAGAPPGTVLASTFTRMAAGEIRDRILMRLVNAIDDEKKRVELGAAIGVAGLTRDAVLELLRHLTRRLHTIQVRTLDSFFASIVQAYGLELGVPPGARVVDEDEAIGLRRRAVGAMLRAHDPPRVAAILRMLTRGGTDRSVMSVIDRTVDGLYELSRETDAAAWDPLPASRELTPAELDEALAALAREAAGALAVTAAAAAIDLDRARSGDWETFISNGPAAKVLADEPTYRTHPLGDGLVAAYRAVLDHARAVLRNRLRRQTLAARELLDLYDTAIRQEKRRARALTFADLTTAVVEAQGVGTFDELCFRLDGAVDHMLLDEFQDTNVQQWRALEPFAIEILHDQSRPRTFFCVGDVKQSIYGWRDACPELLEHLPELLAGPGGRTLVESDVQVDSHRSAQDIMDAVNGIFDGLVSNPALAGCVDGAALFSASFEHHRTTKEELPGYAELRVVSRAESAEEASTVRLRQAAQLVERLHRRSPGQSIGVITRTNDAVSRVLFELGPGRLDVPASGRGGGPLTDEPAVNAVLDLLRLADHPDDTVAAFNVARGPLAPVVELADECSADRRRAVARAIRRRLVERGYAATIGSLARPLVPSCDERGARRLIQLVEVAASYDERATLRADDFVRLVEARRVEAVVPSPVQVMTVHQAKGLEFDVVVLPELEWRLTGESAPPVAFERDGDAGRVTRVCRWARREVRQIAPELGPMFARARVRTVRESLCVLYVAVTRAKQGLYMLVDPPKARSGGGAASIPATAAGVLRGALTNEEPLEPDTIAWTTGDPMRIEIASAPEPTDSVGTPAKVTLASPGDRDGPGTHRSAARPASASHEEGATLGDVLHLPDDEPRARGSVLHRLFEQIEWLDDWRADRAVLVELSSLTAPRRSDAWHEETVDLFLEALARPAVRDALGRGSATPGTRRAWTERPFVRLVDGRVQRGSIDRMVVESDPGGHARRAEVVDLKTDAIAADEAAAQAERYRGQLETYRAVAADATGLDEAAVAMTVLFVSAGVAVGLAAHAERPEATTSEAWDW